MHGMISNRLRALASPFVVAVASSLFCGFGGDVSAQPGAESAPTEVADRPANALAHETSPYLLLHAHNPVDWRPWSPAAFELAKRDNKPIFLSIGYSSCHWCHVMEREVFENEEIAEYVNEHFVSIKVDREERPDVDDIYMLALQVYFQAVGSSQTGGWPLSMFLTPEGKPFAGGTYFPPEDRDGRPGFLTVAKQVQELWATRQADLEGNADFLAREVQRLSRPSLSLKTVEVDANLVRGAVDALQSAYDSEHGGFDFDSEAPNGPKFPTPSRLMLIQAQIDAHSDASLAGQLDHTLQRMAAGGIRDHLGGGFHRYSVDRQWRVPHFEKMLYDNAQLAEVYSEAYLRTNRRTYRQVAEETFDFILRDLTDPQGGFYSALDAETEGIEGKYYVWSAVEVNTILGADDARVFGAAYGLSEPEYFEHGYVLQLPRSLDEIADELDVPLSDLEPQLEAARAALLETRRQRPALLRDDKVLTGWNGLTIRALADGGQILQRPDYLAAAERAALFILAEMRDQQGRLQHTWRGGEARLAAYSDDYAYFVSGLLALHRVTGNEEWLNAARRLTDEQLELFWDDRGHGFFYTPDDHEPLLARVKEAYDAVVPSANSVSVENLIRIAQLTGEESYRRRALQTIRVFAPRLSESPASLSYLALSVDEYLDAFGPVTTEPADAVATAPANSAPADDADEELVPAAEANADQAARHDKVAAKAYLSVDRLPAGGMCRVAVVISVTDGWHINANPANPDYLIPTELTAASRHKSKLTGVEYPDGMQFKLQGEEQPLVVYEEKVVLYGTIEAPADAAGQTEKLELTIRYQACNDMTCLRPAKLVLTGEIPVAAADEKPREINRALFKEKTE